MSPALIAALAAVSGVFGLLSVVAYLFVYYKIKSLEKARISSIREQIEGNQIFTADQVLGIGLPPEKWSSLRYGFAPCGGCLDASEEAYG